MMYRRKFGRQPIFETSTYWSDSRCSEISGDSSEIENEVGLKLRKIAILAQKFDEDCKIANHIMKHANQDEYKSSTDSQNRIWLRPCNAAASDLACKGA